MIDVTKAYHYPEYVRVEYTDNSSISMTLDQYEAFLGFASDRVDERLAKIREIVG